MDTPPILLVGYGRVGQYVVAQVGNPVVVADVRPYDKERLPDNVIAFEVLTSSHSLETIIQQYRPRLAVSAVPGAVGFAMARRLLEAALPVIDVSFYPEDAFRLEPLAVKAGVWYIPDAGIAPGLTNLWLGYWANQMPIEEFQCWVGGLPQKPRAPFYYEAAFHPADALDEYVRPARFRRAGRLIIQAPLQEVQTVDFFPEIGLLEAFPSDGLRTLLQTMDAPTMIEWTLRYPPHMQVMKILNDLNFLTPERLPTLASWLSQHMQVQGPDQTLLYMSLRTKDGTEHTLRMLHYGTNVQLSMPQVTGEVAVAVCQAALDGQLDRLAPGVYPLERLPDLWPGVQARFRALPQIIWEVSE